MSGTININQNNNNVSLQDNNRKIIVTDATQHKTIEVTQPITSVVEVRTIGPQGPIGPPVNLDDIFRILTGSVTASVNTGPTIFLINSGSSEFFLINNQGSTIISSNSPNVFLIKNLNNNPILTVSQSGMLILATQSFESTNPAPNGGIYFTSSSFFVGLD
jgi:hypothetical protein